MDVLLKITRLKKERGFLSKLEIFWADHTTPREDNIHDVSCGITEVLED